MATGTVVSLTVRATGWDADLVLEGDFTAAIACVSGLGTNNALTGLEKLVLTVTSLGFDAAGNATTVVRSVYGTAIVRKVTPNDTLKDATFDATNTTIRIAFNENIFAKDKAGGGNSGTDITCVMLAGFITATAKASLAQSSFTVTNNSTLAYPKCVGRWAWPGFERVTRNFLVEMTGYHPYARNRNPFACVKFDCTDEHSNSAVQQVITNMSISLRGGDAKAVSVYAATIPVSALTQGDVLTVRFRTYPWLGDSTSVLDTDTSADGIAAPSADLTPLMELLDKNDTLACYASVDGVGAGTPTVQTTAALARTTPYSTLATARTALKAFNNTNHSDNSLNNCIVLMQNGTYSGAGTFTGANTKSRCIVKADLANGATEAGVVFSTALNQVDNSYMKYEDVTFSGSGAGMVRGNAAATVWLHSCTLNHTSTSFCYLWKLCQATQNTITALTQGLNSFSTNIGPWGLIRGNSGPSTPITGHSYCTIGNTQIIPGFLLTGNTAGNPISDGIVVGWNQGLNYNGILGSWALNTDIVKGIAFIGNLFEKITENTAPLFQISADNSSTNITNNVYLVNNTMVGQRENLNYQEGGNVASTRNNWYDQYNLFRDFNTKTDTFTNAARTVNDAVFVNGSAIVTSATAAFVAGDAGKVLSTPTCLTGGLGAIATRDSAVQVTLTAPAIASNTAQKIGINGYIADANRIGNWAFVYGAGCKGSRYEVANFPRDFAGIDVAVVGSIGQGYVSDKSVAGTGAGNGDYSLTAGAPGLNRIPIGLAPFPFDLSGNPIANDGTGNAGAMQPIVSPPFPRRRMRSRISQLIGR